MKNATVRYIKPPNTLKMKAGHGGISEDLIERAQEFIANFGADFKPEAEKFVTALKKARQEAERAKQKNDKPLTEIDGIVRPIMQLKANGGMFQYQLISDVADICLQFLESISEYDKEALEIVGAHEKTIMVILEHNLKGDGGKEGYKLVMELHKACKRYFRKHLDKQKK